MKQQQWPQFLLAALAAATLASLSRRQIANGRGTVRLSRPLPRQGRDAEQLNPVSDAPSEKSGDAPPQEGIKPERGRLAESPGEIPTRGWRDVLLRVKQQINEDNVSLTAAGVAFGWLLSIFPLLGGLIAIFGLIADPAEVQRQVEELFGLLSPQVVEILHEQLARLTHTSGATLGFGALFGLLFSLWSANSGTKAMITALDIVYSEKEKRSFFKLNLIALSLTIGMILAVVGALLLLIVLPVVFRFVGMEETVKTTLDTLRWPALAIGFMIALAVFYRYGPSRETPRWRWVTWGSVLATILWIIASGLFSFYVANFANYNKTYGSLGAVVILMIWLYMTAFIILLGAELNAELEHQTAKDSTTRAPKPMGMRGAHMADTLGEQP